MATPLDHLVAARQLRAEASSPAEIDALLKRAAGLLADAGNPMLGSASRFALAYEAALAIATAALRSAGYRADAASGHRAIVFQALPYTLDAPADLWAALGVSHDRHNAVEYSTAPAPTDAEAGDLLSLARRLDGMVRARGARPKKNR
jgi:hypothetical protein